MGNERIRRQHKNYVEPSCIGDLKLFMNIHSAKSEVVLFLDFISLFMIRSAFSPLS